MKQAPDPRAWRSTFVLALIGALSTSCGGGGGGSSTNPSRGNGGGGETQMPFTLSTSEESSFQVQVFGDGAPLPGAIVLITSARQVAELQPGEDPARLGGEVFFRGLTDQHGRVRGELRVPSRHLSLDMVVQARGWEGPFTTEEFRDAAGSFAPSARVNTTLTDLTHQSISLTSL